MPYYRRKSMLIIIGDLCIFYYIFAEGAYIITSNVIVRDANRCHVINRHNTYFIVYSFHSCHRYFYNEIFLMFRINEKSINTSDIFLFLKKHII